MMASDVPRDDESTGAWAQSVKRAFRFVFLAVCLAALAWSLSGIRRVPPESRAVVYRFGVIVHHQGAGLLLAWPRPIEQVVILPSAEQQIEFQIDGFQSNANPDHYIYGNPRQNKSMLLTGDGSVVDLRGTLLYEILDPAAFILSAEHLGPALQRLFSASAIAICATRDLDTILVARPEIAAGPEARSAREQLRADLMNAINDRLNNLTSSGVGLGIRISRVDLEASIPNGAKNAFDQVLVVSQKAEADIAESRTKASRIATQANQIADRTRTASQAKATERVAEATTRTATIRALAQGSPGLSGDMLINRIYYDRVGALLSKAARVDTVDANGAVNLILPGPAQK